jgi:hypothetical protein
MASDRSDDRDVRLTIRTTVDTKRRIARAAAHHDLTISKYIKLCAIEHMLTHDLWELPGRVNQQNAGDEKRPRLSRIHETKDPDDKEIR